MSDPALLSFSGGPNAVSFYSIASVISSFYLKIFDFFGFLTDVVQFLELHLTNLPATTEVNNAQSLKDDTFNHAILELYIIFSTSDVKFISSYLCL